MTLRLIALEDIGTIVGVALTLIGATALVTRITDRWDRR